MTRNFKILSTNADGQLPDVNSQMVKNFEFILKATKLDLVFIIFGFTESALWKTVMAENLFG